MPNPKSTTINPKDSRYERRTTGGQVSGNDVILGKGGSDSIWGGNGADSFQFNNDAKNNPHIYDFAGGVDKIILDADANWSASFVDEDTTKFTSSTGGTIVVDGLDIGHVWNSLELV